MIICDDHIRMWLNNMCVFAKGHWTIKQNHKRIPSLKRTRGHSNHSRRLLSAFWRIKKTCFLYVCPAMQTTVISLRAVILLLRTQKDPYICPETICSTHKNIVYIYGHKQTAALRANLLIRHDTHTFCTLRWNVITSNFQPRSIIHLKTPWMMFVGNMQVWYVR